MARTSAHHGDAGGGTITLLMLRPAAIVALFQIAVTGCGSKGADDAGASAGATSLHCGAEVPAGAMPPSNMIDPDGGGDGATDGCVRQEGGNGVAWALRCGGMTRDWVVGAAINDAGEIYVGLNVHNPEGAVPFRFGDFEIIPGEFGDTLIVKFSGEGDVLWVKHVTGPGWEELHALRGCGDGVAIAGAAPAGTIDLGGGVIEDAYYVAVFDAEGALRWSRSLAASDVVEDFIDVRDIACDSCGGLSMTGRFRGPIDLGGGAMTPAQVYDGFVAHYDGAGSFRWARGLGAGSGQGSGVWEEAWGAAVTHAPSGEILLGASFSGTIDPGDGALASTAGWDALAVTYDRDGGVIWSRQIGSEGEQLGEALAADAKGSLALGGVFYDTITVGAQIYENVFPDQSPDIDGVNYDGFVVFMDQGGLATSAIHVATMFDDEIDGLAFDSKGILVMSGSSSGAYTLRAFVGGELAWSWSTAEIRGDAFAYTAITDDAVVIAASEVDAVDFGGGVLGPRGAEDLVLVKVLR